MTSLLRIASLALCSLVTSSALAAPEPIPPVAPSGPPEDAALRRVNLSSNPLFWPFGIYGLTVSFAPARHLAIRGDVTYYSPVESDVQGHELSLGLPIYLRSAYQGPFLEPGFTYVRLEGLAGQEMATLLDGYGGRLMGPQLLVGWAWMWRGLNLAAAAGGTQHLGAERPGAGEHPIVPNAYLRMGYAF